MQQDDGWQLRAACRGVRVEMFFPPVEQEADEAKAVCALCEVREPCLEAALVAGETFGVWGGLTPQERRSLLAKRRRQASARPRPEEVRLSSA